MKCGSTEMNIFNKNLVFIKLMILVVCLFAGILVVPVVVVGSLWLYLWGADGTAKSPDSKPESGAAANRADSLPIPTNRHNILDNVPAVPLEESVRNFAAKIYKEMLHEPRNILFSPSSLHICTALVQLAAEGETLRDIAGVLQLPEDKDQVRSIYKQATLAMKSTHQNILSSANRIFVKDNFEISKNFATIAQDTFDAGLESINFTDKSGSAAKINDWIKQQTRDKISNVITPDVIEDLTKLILINALYFKGTWINPFDSELTRPRPFKINSTTEVQTEIMYTSGDFLYYEDKELKAKYVELPYLDDEFQMMIILPNEVDGLANLEKNLDKVLQLDPSKLRLTEQLTILLPKFRIEKKTNLDDILRKLGMGSAFEDDELTGFSEKKIGLHISHVLQKTFIDVNEKGTEAGAVTADIISDRMLGTYFNANHPFLFVLKQKSGLIHFIGRFIDPSEKN